MKIDYKKIKPIALTYISLSAPVAMAAFAMNACYIVKLLSFFSGIIPIIIRQANPKDAFTLNILAVAKAEIDSELAKQKKLKG